MIIVSKMTAALNKWGKEKKESSNTNYLKRRRTLKT